MSKYTVTGPCLYFDIYSTVLMHIDSCYVIAVLIECKDSLQKSISFETFENEGNDPRANSLTDELLFEIVLMFLTPGAYEKLSSANEDYWTVLLYCKEKSSKLFQND